MRNKKTKAIKNQIYGDDYSPKFRKYQRRPSGQIIADLKRQLYQRMKKVV